MKMLMKAALAAAFAAVCAAAPAAEANSAAPITPDGIRAQLEKMPAGNAERGRKVHEANFCSSCHGAAGVAPTENWPTVSGQPEYVTKKALIEFRGGFRRGDRMDELMTAAAKKLSDADIADLAAFYAAQPGAPAATAELPAPELVTKGDTKRMIAPCAMCHGKDATGSATGIMPILHGQSARYHEAALKKYRAGERKGDFSREMRMIAEQLTDKEISELAAYYASLPGKDAAKPAKK